MARVTYTEQDCTKYYCEHIVRHGTLSHCAVKGCDNYMGYCGYHTAGKIEKR